MHVYESSLFKSLILYSSIESPGAKSTAALNIVKLVQSYGVKIDGIGLQDHLIVGSSPSLEDQVANMRAFADLGLEVAITELDIRAENPEAGQYHEQQSKDYAATIGACNEVKECVGVTIWDFTDKYSWGTNFGKTPFCCYQYANVVCSMIHPFLIWICPRRTLALSQLLQLLRHIFPFLPCQINHASI